MRAYGAPGTIVYAMASSGNDFAVSQPRILLHEQGLSERASVDMPRATETPVLHHDQPSTSAGAHPVMDREQASKYIEQRRSSQGNLHISPDTCPITCTPGLATWCTCCSLVLIIGALLSLQQPMGVDEVHPTCLTPGCQSYSHMSFSPVGLRPGSATQQRAGQRKELPTQHKSQLLYKRRFDQDTGGSLKSTATTAWHRTQSLPCTQEDTVMHGKLKGGEVRCTGIAAHVEAAAQVDKHLHISTVNEQQQQQQQPEHELGDYGATQRHSRSAEMGVWRDGASQLMSWSWMKHMMRSACDKVHTIWNSAIRLATGRTSHGVSSRVQQKLGLERHANAVVSTHVAGFFRQVQLLAACFAHKSHMNLETWEGYKTWILEWFERLYSAVLIATLLLVSGMILCVFLVSLCSINVPKQYVTATLKLSGLACARLTSFGVWCLPGALRRAAQPHLDHPLLIGTITYLSGTLITWSLCRVVCWSYISWSAHVAPVVKNAWGALCCIVFVIYCSSLLLGLCYCSVALVTITAMLVLLVGFPVCDETGDRALEAASGEIGPRSLSFWDLEPRSLGASASSLSQSSVYRLE